MLSGKHTFIVNVLCKVLYYVMEKCRHWLWDLGEEFYLE